jgi:hypothetical protein
MAVMSSEMLFLGILTFAMVLIRLQVKAGLLGFGTESLDDAESNLIDGIGEVVDFAGEEVVEDNGEG